MIKESQNLKWIARGAWAIADQGFFALANVLLNVLLARWLAPAEYGAFAVAYSLLLFVGAFHTAFLTEPLLVFGPAKYARQTRTYLSALLRGHWALMAAGSGVILISGFVLQFSGATSLARAMFGLAVAAPFSLLMWFGRRAAYLRFQPRLASVASAGYLLLLLAGLSALAALHAVSIFSAMAITGAAGAIIGFWLLWRIFSELPEEEKHSTPPAVFNDHWRYGRWASATSVLMWIPLNFFFLVLSLVINLEASAALKALSNLVLPLLQANAALGSLLLPAMVLRAGHGQQFRRLLCSALGLFAGGACLYSIVIGTFSRLLVHLLYSGRYDAQTNLLWLLLIIPLLDGAMVVLASALRSLERPDLVFYAQFIVGGFVLIAGVICTRVSGLWGAAAAIAFGDVLGTIILSVFAWSQLKQRHGRQTSVRHGWLSEEIATN
jgi:O-antigen/teichoic acid export membrane protein